MLVSDDESGDVDVENEDDNYEFYLWCWLPAVLGRLIDILFQFTEQPQFFYVIL